MKRSHVTIYILQQFILEHLKTYVSRYRDSLAQLSLSARLVIAILQEIVIGITYSISTLYVYIWKWWWY